VNTLGGVVVGGDDSQFIVLVSDVYLPPDPLDCVDTHASFSGPCAPQSRTLYQPFLSLDWRYSSDSAIVIVLVYVSSFSPSVMV
jgi:hypothetical protein